MHLIDRLTAAARQLPGSHTVSFHDLPGLMGALAIFLEDGEDFLDAVEQDDGMATYLHERATAENERVEREQGRGSQPQPGPVNVAPVAPDPSFPAPAVQSDQAPGSFPGQTAAVPAQPTAPTPAAAPPSGPPAGWPDPEDEPERELSDAEIVAQIQSLQARLGDRQRTTVTSQPPADEPPAGEAPAGESPAPEHLP